MGMCKPSGGKFDEYGRRGSNISHGSYEKNTRIDYYDEKTGELMQQRWFGSNGLAVWDRDYIHGDPNHTHFFPHDHSWDWSKKIPRQDCVPINNFYC